MKTLFWLSIAVIFYAYAGYPLIILVLSRLFPQRVAKNRNGPVRKDVSVVIAAKNEERNIGRRIDNLLHQTYAEGRMEVIVVCDGSTDDTGTIVNLYVQKSAAAGDDSQPRIKLISYWPSQGKPHALNVGVGEASGEIIVFADARQDFHEKAISELVSNFDDAAIGCVSGELLFYDSQDSGMIEQMGLYWNYEKYVRKCESSFDSVPGVTGAIYAVRKSLFTPMPKELLLDDVYVPMNVILRGKRAVFDGKALAYDTVSRDFQLEKRRKVRTLLGNWQLLRIMPILLNPFRNPIWFQYISHKVLGRLIVPFCFIAYLATLSFVSGYFYRVVFLATIALFLLAIIDLRLLRIGPLQRIASVSRAIFSLNYFSLVGFCYFVTGRKRVW